MLCWLQQLGGGIAVEFWLGCLVYSAATLYQVRGVWAARRRTWPIPRAVVRRK